MSSLSVLSGLVIVCLGYGALVMYRYLTCRRPGDRIMYVPESTLAMVVSPIWPPKNWIGSVGSHFIPFSRDGQTIIPLVWAPTGERYYQIADVSAAKAVFEDRHGFVKRSEDSNNALLWVETVTTLNEWFSEWDFAIAREPKRQKAVNITTELRDITLFVIASAGFGMHFSHGSMGFHKPGYKMSFGESLVIAIETMLVKAMAPRWMYVLPIKALTNCDMAYTELKQYIVEMIAEARAGNAVDRRQGGEATADLFQRLVVANDEESDAKARLSDEETVANIYTFFLAGHGNHLEIQDKVHEEAKLLWPSFLDDSVYSLAVFRETLRLFPAEPTSSRYATVDTTMPCSARNPKTGEWEPSVAYITRGAGCTDLAHVQYLKAMYWGEDCDVFRPERFIDTAEYRWPRDAWLPFTGGPHVCLGQRFAMIESACIIARFMRKYCIRPTPEVARMPKQEQWARLTKWTQGVTSTPGRVDLIIEPRDVMGDGKL
ncbi:cytochrome P450 [Auriculariales sp. MPI-PUGE-AT-0066]|nr:cytochrome P450 [Auriculariales sp. MPI-PUGE-AT-0066]